MALDQARIGIKAQKGVSRHLHEPCRSRTVGYVKDSATASRLRDLDLYALLDVSTQASFDEIRRAFRRGALTCHPDMHPNDKAASERFLQLTQARDILLDAELRAAYDRIRAQARAEQPPGGVVDGRPRRRTRRSRVSDPLDEQRLAERARRSRSAAELTTLWQAGSVVVRAEILRNSTCPVALFHDPHVQGHWLLSLEAASRPQCPSDVLDRLALSFEHSVAMAVAAHPGTPAEGLAIITSRHRDLGVLTAVAMHVNATASVLREVSRAVRGPRSASLGAAVLAHPSCPADVAQRIRARLGDMVA